MSMNDINQYDKCTKDIYQNILEEDTLIFPLDRNMLHKDFSYNDNLKSLFINIIEHTNVENINDGLINEISTIRFFEDHFKSIIVDVLDNVVSTKDIYTIEKIHKDGAMILKCNYESTYISDMLKFLFDNNPFKYYGLVPKREIKSDSIILIAIAECKEKMQPFHTSPSKALFNIITTLLFYTDMKFVLANTVIDKLDYKEYMFNFIKDGNNYIELKFIRVIDLIMEKVEQEINKIIRTLNKLGGKYKEITYPINERTRELIYSNECIADVYKLVYNYIYQSKEYTEYADETF